MIVPPETLQRNRLLLLGLIVFAVGLCAVVLLWMRATVRAKGGIVDPQQPHAVLWRPALPSRYATGLEFFHESPLTAAHPYHL